MKLNCIDVKNNALDVYWVAAAGVFTLNIINVVFWAFGFFVSPYVYLLFALFFFGFALKIDKKDLIILIVFVFFILMILSRPLTAWDARSIWFFHAKRIFIDNNLFAQLDGYAPWSHNDYPILVSALAASFAKSIGFWNEYFPRLSLLCVLLPIFLAFKWLINNNFIFNLWIIGAIIICKRTLIDGHMDGILALYVSAACLLLMTIKSWLKHDFKRYVLLLLILIALPFIKNEGFLALLVILFCITPACFSNYKFVGLLVLPLIIYLAFWRYQVEYHHIRSDLFTEGIIERAQSRLIDFSELWQIIEVFLMETGAYFVILGYLVFKFQVVPKKIYMPMLFVSLYTTCILLIYLITPHDLTWHLNTSASRAFLVTNMCIFSTIMFLYSEVD